MATATATPEAPTKLTEGQIKEIVENGEPKSKRARKLVEGGLTRSEAAKALDTSYQQVFAATQGMKNVPSGRVFIGDKPISQRIREYVAEHPKATRSEVAKALDVPYQRVFQVMKAKASAPLASATAAHTQREMEEEEDNIEEEEDVEKE